jgi:hypothetical protein
MEKKPHLINILIVLWAIVCFFFLGLLVTHISDYKAQLESMDDSYSMGGSYFQDSKWNAIQNFNFVTYFILYLFLTISAFLLAFGTFIKKSWSWFFGMMFSSFLGFYVFLGITSIGSLMIMDNIDNMFTTPYSAFHYTTSFALIFLVPIFLFTLTRPSVKTYFGKI